MPAENGCMNSVYVCTEQAEDEYVNFTIIENSNFLAWKIQSQDSGNLSSSP
jgi:hypothetical protein